MKILLITPSPPEYLGGLALFCKDLAINLRKKGVNIDILTSTLSKKGPIYQKLNDNINVFKQKVYLFPDNNNFLKVKNPIFFIFNFLKKNGYKYDLIHVHSYIYFSTIQAFLYKFLFNKKILLILHLHGGIQTEEYKFSSKIERILLMFKKYFFDILIGRFMIYPADALISVSKEDILSINKVFKIDRKKHNYYLPNVVDTNKFRKIDNIEKIYIGFIGRLTKIKGIDLFLKIIEELNKIDKNQQFLIIGEGPYINDVREAVNKYPIKFLEHISHDEIVKYYNKCLIFVQTSRAEGLPTCVLEALSCEVPVVASDVGGTNEIIFNGVNGFLFENGNVEQAIKYINLIKNNKYSEKLSKDGRELIKLKYSWEAITKKIIQIYRKILIEKLKS